MSGGPAVCRLGVSLSPRARADALAGWSGGDLKIRVAAPPAGGAANAALLKFLAGLLGLGAGRLSLAAGHKSRRKIVAVEGLTGPELRRRLEALLPGFPEDRPGGLPGRSAT